MAILPKLVGAPVLKDALKKSTSSLKILDCTYNLTAKPDYIDFKENVYGKFADVLIPKISLHKDSYLSAHIPTAQFFDIDAAFYPTKYKRFVSYPPETFEKYAQLLGINADDHLLFYGRGNPFQTMIFPARVYWLFKSYGHSNLSLLNGGFNEWQRNYFEIEKSNTTDVKPKSMGNWTASKNDNKLSLSYEYVTNKDGNGVDLLENAGKTNVILDARNSNAYNGKEITGLSENVKGSHLPGTINMPALELLNEDGTMKSEKEIKQKMEEVCQNILSSSLPIITMCNVGMQASFINFVLDTFSIESRLYSGGLYELANLNPERISGGKNL